MKGTAEEPEIVVAASGRYSLDQQIGRGGVGEVFRAHDTQLHRFVAIKRLHGEDLAVQERAGLIIQEARHLAALQHPNIVTVYDFIEKDGDVLVVMELLRGRTLEELVAVAPLIPKDFVEIMRQILEGLHAAHDTGMLHRDIKPTNIMLMDQRDSTYQVKILDFGLAKITAAPSLQSTELDGSLVGSIYFMSPEQFEGGTLDARSDLYSLGCVAYYLLTTHHPFRGETVPEVICSHLQGNRFPLREMRPDLPPGLCQWVERLMAVKPQDRPDSAADASRELMAAVAGKNIRPASLPVPVRPLDDPKTRRLLALYLGSAAALVMAIGSPILWPDFFKTRKAGIEPASEMAAAQPLLVAPNDKAALLSHVGQGVMVEGRIDRTGQSDSGEAHFLNFAGTQSGDLTLVFFVKDGSSGFTPERLADYVGKTVRVRGPVSLFEGTPRIVVQSHEQLETL